MNISDRKLYYPINVIIFFLCRLWLFRSRKIWIFGALEGKKYDENSRYLFEYLQKRNVSGLRLIWLTKHQSVVDELRGKGYEAYTNSSLMGKFYQLRAGVAFYTHGLIDFGVVPMVGGAEIVALWHGVGFKKIYNAAFSGLTLLKRKCFDFFFCWTYRTMTMTTSAYSGMMSIQAFKHKKREIYYTGQPRNDIFRTVNRTEILQKLNINPNKKVIIYMPTYRKPTLGEDAMEKIVRDLYENEQLNDLLNRENFVFLCKLHPATPFIDLKERDNFKILDYKVVDDNQALLGSCDMLVTDYSSCFVDFALLNRPFILYFPDDERFLSMSESMMEEFFELRKKIQKQKLEKRYLLYSKSS